MFNADWYAVGPASACIGTDAKLEYTNAVDPVGWISATQSAPAVDTPQAISIKIGVQDAAGQSVETERVVVRLAGGDCAAVASRLSRLDEVR